MSCVESNSKQDPAPAWRKSQVSRNFKYNFPKGKRMGRADCRAAGEHVAGPKGPGRKSHLSPDLKRDRS